jgi:hypothetical protein
MDPFISFEMERILFHNQGVPQVLIVFEVARNLCSSPYNLFGVDWVGERVGNKLVWSSEDWRLAPLCTMWCTWREQNARSFQDRETSTVELKRVIFSSIYK